jgi:chemotaxis protein CheX
MQPELFSPFTNSIQQTFQTMLGCSLHALKIQPANAGPVFHEVTGVMSFSGRAEGSMVLSLSRSVALRAASTLLMVESDEINDDVVDAVGEITNMISGAAKAQLEQYEMRIGLPNVVCGAGHSVKFPSSVVPMCLPFESEWGLLSLTVGLVVIDAPLPCEVC